MRNGEYIIFRGKKLKKRKREKRNRRKFNRECSKNHRGALTMEGNAKKLAENPKECIRLLSMFRKFFSQRSEFASV